MENSEQGINFNLKYLLSMTMADVDIFLLQDEKQEEDNDKLYSKEEIREQLKKSLEKSITILMKLNVNIEKPLGNQLSMMGEEFFTKAEWKQITKDLMK